MKNLNNNHLLYNQNQIEYGEIAINYAVGEETISLKNSSNQIVEFKTDQYYKNIIDENEFATANALTDLNYRLNETNELLDTKSPTGHTHVSSEITDSISVSSSITSSANGLVQGKAVYNYAAPKSHATSSTTYGAATTSNYGHVKISNGDVATVASANGLAAGMDHSHSNYSPTGHTHVSSAITDSISTSDSITSGASGLVQGKAVYNYAAPKSHTHVSSAITDSINSMSGITGTETKLVQAKAVYELINDTEEQIAETLLEHDSRLTTLSNNFDSIVTDIEENELVTATAITELENLVNGIGEELDNKSNNGHTHSNYSTTGHTHVSSDITDFIKCKFSYNIATSGGYSTIPITFVSGSTTFTNGDLIEISFTGNNTSLQTGGFTTTDKNFKIGYYNTDGNFEIFDNTYLHYCAGCKAYFRVLYPVNNPSVPFDATTIIIAPIFNTANGGFSSYANNAASANTVKISTSTLSTSYPLVFTSNVTAGNKSLYTDSVNSLYYNPSSNTLTVPTASITTASTTTMKASTIANKTSGSTITFDDCIKIKTSSYVQGSINFKGTDHNNDVLFISGGSSTSAPSITIKTKNSKDYVGINMLGKADANTAAEIKVYGTSTGSCTTIQGGKNATVTSDERLKDFGDNIEVDFNELKQIPKKYFTWKNDEIKASNIGTSAQSIEKLYPELVITDDNGYKSLDYSTLSIVALAAIDKLNERIEYLENKLKEYENK